MALGPKHITYVTTPLEGPNTWKTPPWRAQTHAKGGGEGPNTESYIPCMPNWSIISPKLGIRSIFNADSESTPKINPTETYIFYEFTEVPAIRVILGGPHIYLGRREILVTQKGRREIFLQWKIGVKFRYTEKSGMKFGPKWSIFELEISKFSSIFALFSTITYFHADF